MANGEGNGRNPIDIFKFMLDMTSSIGKAVQAIDDLAKDVENILAWKDRIGEKGYVCSKELDKKFTEIWKKLEILQKLSGRVNALIWFFSLTFVVVILQAIIFFWKVLIG